MRVLIIIIVLCFSSFSLIAEWEKTDKGYISSDTLVGNMRYILNENALVVESKHSIKKVDLNTGKVIKEIVFDDTTHSFAVADDNLDNVYLLYDTLISTKGKYVYIIKNFKNNDTIIGGEIETPYYGPKVERNLSLLNDSLLFFTGNMIEDYHIFQSTTPFSKIIKLDLFSSVKGIIDSDFYFDRYNLWNSRRNSIIVVSEISYSTGKHGGRAEVKLKRITFDSLVVEEFNRRITESNDSYVPKAKFYSYSTSNNGGIVYYHYYYYDYDYLPNGTINYTRIVKNEVFDFKNGKTYQIDQKLGDCVIFSTDDRWLVATKMRGENSVDFNVFDLEGELIFTDNISNVTNEQIICYTDSTYFFESGSKILMYNPFENSLTNVSEQNSNSSLYTYPNPTNKFLNINLPESNSLSLLTVVDQKGNKIESISLDAEVMQSQFYKLDVSSYPIGIYILRLSNRTNTIIGKFIKE